MKNIIKLFILIFLTSITIYTNEDKMSKIKEIEKIAEKLASDQLTAYNNRDIDNFLIPFSDSVEVYMFPNELLYKGKEEMRKRYKTMFENTPELHCKLTNRTVLGNKVIDSEEVSGKLDGDIVRAIAIYTIENDKIQKVHFIKPSM